MIPVERLHYKLDMKLNKLASNSHQAISTEDKDFALREAEIQLIKKKLGGGVQGIGMDGFKRRYQDLQFLVVPPESKVPLIDNSNIANSYILLSSLKEKFLMPIDTYLECSRDNCKKRIVWVESIARHEDVRIYLNSTHHMPSFNYQVTFATISDDRFIIYTEDKQGVFKIDKMFISYLRYPASICFGGYEDFDGTEKVKIDSEFPEYLEDEILDIAWQNLALITENQFAAQAAQLKIKENE